MTSPHPITDLRLATACTPHDTECLECHGVIAMSEHAFVDLVSGRYLHDQCGKILRFHRRKAFDRGEKIPATTAEVDAMLHSRQAAR